MPINNIILPGVPIDPTVDPLFANVILLLNMDGANGANTFADSSSYNRTVSKVGSPTVDGANGLVLNGSSALSVPASADFLFPGDFCWELFITNNSVSGTQDLLNCGPMSFDGATTNKWSMLLSGAGLQTYPKNYNYGGFTSGMTVGVRRHVAAYRIGSILYMAINGVVTAFPGIDIAGTIGNSASVVSIGGRLAASNFVNGIEGPVRITKGNARYGTANFTPPDFGPFQIK